MKSEIPERYEIISELGTGGMGSVYLALDKILDEKVAIKVLAKTSIADDPRVIQRFQREAMAAGKLAHQNLVSTLDFDVSPSGQPYLVMDYAEGVTLKDHLAAVGALPLDQIHDIFKQILAGIAHAHKEGVVHRDLKTSNIVLVDDEDGKLRAMVIDFGIALILEDGQSSSELTRTNAVLGSPLYMSPEQVRGEKADERSDIYSLGCVLYECLTGSPPFRGESSLHTMEMHLNAAPPLVTGMFDGDTELEERLNKVLTKALTKEPSRRFSIIEEFAAALSEALLEDEHSTAIDGDEEVPTANKRKQDSFGTKLLILASSSIILFTLLAISYVVLMPIFDKPQVRTDSPVREIEHIVPLPEGKHMDEDFLSEKLARIVAKNGQILTVRARRWSRQKFIQVRDSSAADTITSLSIPYCEFDNPADIGLLSDLSITSMNLSTTNFDNEGAAELKKFKQLQGLKIGGCKAVTDEGIKSVSEIKTLTSLDIGGGVTGRCLTDVLKLKNLYSLDLKLVKDLSAEQLASLSGLKLTCLFIHNRNLSSEYLRAIAEIGTLEKLKFIAVRLVDSDQTGMNALAGMKRLQEIEFFNTVYSLDDLRRFHALNKRCKLLEPGSGKNIMRSINLEGAE